MASALCADVLKAADLFKPPPSSPIYSTACNLAQQAAAGIRAYNFTGLLDHDAKVSGAAFQRDRGLRHLHDQRQSHSHLRRRRPSPCEAGCLRRAASVEPLRQLPAANHVSSSAAASSAIRRSMDTRGSSSPRSSTHGRAECFRPGYLNIPSLITGLDLLQNREMPENKAFCPFAFAWGDDDFSERPRP